MREPLGCNNIFVLLENSGQHVLKFEPVVHVYKDTVFSEVLM